jgi:hypothetical protein
MIAKVTTGQRRRPSTSCPTGMNTGCAPSEPIDRIAGFLKTHLLREPTWRRTDGEPGGI